MRYGITFIRSLKSIFFFFGIRGLRKVVINRNGEENYRHLRRNFGNHRGGINKHHYRVEGDYVAGLIYY